MTNSIDIRLTDGIDPSIKTNIERIGKIALKTDASLKRVQKTLNSLKLDALTKLASVQNKAAASTSKLAAVQVKQRAAADKSRESAAKLVVSQQRLATEAARTAAVQTRASTTASKAAAASTALQVKALNTQQEAALRLTVTRQRLATEAQRTAAAQARASAIAVQSSNAVTAANTRQVLAHERVQKATITTATAQARLGVVEAKQSAAATGATIATIKLATAQQKLSIDTNKAASAQSRASAEATKASIVAASAQSKVALAEERANTAAINTTASQSRANAARTRAATTTIRHEQALLRLEAQQKRVIRSSRGMSVAAVRLRSIMTTLVAAYGIRTLIRLSDTYTNVQNKLKLVNAETASLAIVTLRVTDIARRSRAQLDAVATTYQRIRLALKPLGVTQEEVLRITETLSKALAISGLSGQEAASGLRQITQAFNKGKLDGDEFRSVMENVPIVMDAIAKQLGVTRGELLELAPQGIITGKVMREALGAAAEDIDKKFANTNATLSQAGVVMANAATIALESFNQITGASAAAADGVIFIADNMIIMAKVIATSTVILGTLYLVLNTGLVTWIAQAGAIAAVNIVLAVNVGVVGTAAVAWSSFTAVLLLNPFVFVAAAVVTLTAALIVLDDIETKTAKKIDTLNAKLQKQRTAMLRAHISTQRLAASGALLIQSKEAVVKALIAENIELDKNTDVSKRQILINELLAKARSEGLSEEDLAKLRKFTENAVDANIALRKQKELFDQMQEPLKQYEQGMANIAGLLGRNAITIEQAIAAMSNLELPAQVIEIAAFVRDDATANQIDELKKGLAERRAILENAHKVELITTEQLGIQLIALESMFQRDKNSVIDTAFQKTIDNHEAMIAAARIHANERIAQREAVEDILASISFDKDAEAMLRVQRTAETEIAIIKKAVFDRELLVTSGELIILQIKGKAAADSIKITKDRVDKEIKEEERLERKRENLRRSRLSSTANLLGSLAQLLAASAKDGERESKSRLRAAKIVGLASIAISTAQAAMESYKNLGGFPFGLIGVAAAVAAGALQVQALNKGSTGFSHGGHVQGAGGPTDDAIPVRLSNGEFVLREAVVRNNRAALTEFNRTGVLPSNLSPRLPATSPEVRNAQNSTATRGSRSATSSNVTINITTPPGTTTRTEATTRNGEEQYDIFIEQLDSAFADKLARDDGAFNEGIRDLVQRQF